MKRVIAPAWATLPMLMVATALAQPPGGDTEPAPDTEPPVDPDPVTQTPGGELTKDLVAEALKPMPGGLTPRKVGRRAVKTSPVVRVRRAELMAAAARVDQAYASYVPSVTVGASYTRISPVENDLGFTSPVPGIDTTFEVVQNQYSLSANLEVPLSDYVLRLTQAFAAVSLDVDAKDLQVRAQELQTRADAQIVYFNWVRARGQAVVTAMAVDLSERHLKDARLTMSAGLLSEADLKRLEAQKAQSLHLQRAALNFEEVAAEQLRNILHLPDDTPLDVGIDVLAEPKPLRQSLKQLRKRALDERLELKALDKSAESLSEVESASRATHYPRLSAFAEGLYANPNPRIFPQTSHWDFTWAVGVRMTWTINDTFSTIGKAHEIEAQRIAVEEQRNALADAIRSEVTAAYYDMDTARSAVEAAKEREEAATASLDARRKIFRGGNATATDIVDGEVELTNARLQRVDAHIDYLVAKARLELAVGGRVK